MSFVSRFQALIKIICSDCLGKLFFVLLLPSLYQNNFGSSRFLCGGVQTLCGEMEGWGELGVKDD